MRATDGANPYTEPTRLLASRRFSRATRGVHNEGYCVHMEVGVRELKQQLSRYLDEVEAGAEVLVTDRGRPKARLVPVTDHGRLQRGIDDGWIRPAVRAMPVGTAARQTATRRSADVLAEDRG
jgi:prevent-host-death family protein